MFQEIKNIVFDFGGVLIDLHRDRCVAAFEHIGYPQAAAMLDLYHPSDLFNQLEKGTINTQNVCDHIRHQTGKAISNEAICAAYTAFIGEIPINKLRAIRALREAGFATYALSNINEIVTPFIFDVLFRADGLTVNDYFIHTFLSYEMKLLKPDPAIFHQMLAESKMIPAETLFLDDSEKNVLVASEIGIQVYMPQAKEDFTPLLYDLIQEKNKLS
ncbi:MAG: HAD family phosphatase [Alistipes sp.]